MGRYTEAQNRASQKYIKNHYDTYTLRLPKGDREKYKQYAESRGTSLSKLIVELLEQDIREH